VLDTHNRCPINGALVQITVPMPKLVHDKGNWCEVYEMVPEQSSARDIVGATENGAPNENRCRA